MMKKMMSSNDGGFPTGGQKPVLREKGSSPLNTGEESTVIKFATLNCWYAQSYHVPLLDSLTNLELGVSYGQVEGRNVLA